MEVGESIGTPYHRFDKTSPCWVLCPPHPLEDHKRRPNDVSVRSCGLLDYGQRDMAGSRNESSCQGVLDRVFDASLDSCSLRVEICEHAIVRFRCSRDTKYRHALDPFWAAGEARPGDWR